MWTIMQMVYHQLILSMSKNILKLEVYLIEVRRNALLILYLQPQACDFSETDFSGG